MSHDQTVLVTIIIVLPTPESCAETVLVAVHLNSRHSATFTELNQMNHDYIILVSIIILLAIQVSCAWTILLLLT